MPRARETDATGGPDFSHRGTGVPVGRSIAWASFGAVTRQGATFLGTLVLARLLIPEDYGVAAVALAITIFASILTDFGIGPAIVHRSELTRSFVASAFWLNALSGLVLTSCVVLAAEPLADLYGRPELADLMRLASLNSLLSLAVIPLALLQRRRAFRRIAVVEVSAACVGVLAAISCAVAGFGAASLVAGPLVTTLVASVLSIASAPIPTSAPTREDMHAIWQFSWGLVAFSSTNYWSRNADNLLLGLVDTASLGLYSRAYQLMMLPVEQVPTVLQRVLLPSLAEVQHDPPGMGRRWLRTIHMSWAVGLPLSVGAAVTAPALIPTLLGPGWSGAAPLLTILSLSVPPQLIARTAGAVFQATGQTARQFRVGLVSTLVVIGCIAAGLPWGAIGVATGVAVGMYFTGWIFTRHVLAICQLSGTQLWKVLWPGAICACAMAVGCLLLAVLLADQPAPVILAAQTLTGGALYGMAIVGADRNVRGLLTTWRASPSGMGLTSPDSSDGAR